MIKARLLEEIGKTKSLTGGAARWAFASIRCRPSRKTSKTMGCSITRCCSRRGIGLGKTKARTPNGISMNHGPDKPRV